MAKREDVDDLPLPVHVHDQPVGPDSEAVRLDRAQQYEMQGRILRDLLQFADDAVPQPPFELAEFPRGEGRELDPEPQAIIPRV